MADVNAATIEVPEDGVVTVDVTDKPELATLGELEADGADEASIVTVTSEPEPKPEKKPIPRVRLGEQAVVKTTPEVEAAAALNQAVKTANDRATAAEATALAERRGREQAEARAQQFGETAKTAQEQAEAGELALLSTGIDNATREVAAYEAEHTRALEAGEFAKASSAQVKLSKAAAALDRLEAAKADFEAGNRKSTTEGRVEAPAAALSSFEQYVAGFSPVAQTWLRAHPECVPAVFGGNAVSNAKMMKGHYAALEQGLPEGTPDYFRVIEETAGYRAPVSAAAAVTSAGVVEDEQLVAPAPKRKLVQPSAPVSREPPNAQGQIARTTRSVTLSKEQQEAAKLSWPNLPANQAFAQYARNLLELEAEGKIGRTSH